MIELLIVEDDPEIAKLVRLNLADSGFEVDWVDNGHAALKQIGEHAPELFDMCHTVIAISELRRDIDR